MEPLSFLTIEKFFSVHEVEEEVNSCMIKRDKENAEKRKIMRDEDIVQYPVEHSYIDFKWVIIGEKIRSIDTNKGEIVIDDEYIARLILMQQNNMEVFTLSTIQKLIDFQFVKTKVFMSGLLWFFILFYIAPYSMTIIHDDIDTQITLFNFCFFSQIILLSIELIQLYEMGLKYFKSGWNYVDLL